MVFQIDSYSHCLLRYAPVICVCVLAVNQVDDTVRSNDTISRIINVRFCAGTYPIGNTGIYQNFTAAIDTLMNAGVDGPVVFAVQNGTYVEQLTLGKVDGVSNVNTVTLRMSIPLS